MKSVLRALFLALFIFQPAIIADIILTRCSNRSLVGFNDVYVEGNYAYCAYNYGLVVIDVSNPEKPLFVAQIIAPHEYINSQYSDVEIQGQYLFAAAGLAGLHVYDLTDPMNPVVISRIDTWGFANELYVSDNRVFVAASFEGGLDIIGISDPHEPVRLTFKRNFDYINGVAVNGEFVYEVSYDYGLSIYDVRIDERLEYACQPVILEELYFCNNEDIQINGSNAYVATDRCGLFIVDISEPCKPKIASHFDSLLNCVRVIVEGDRAFAARGERGIVIVDVKKASSPELLAYLDTPGNCTGIFVKENFAYLADSEAGLHIVDISHIRRPNIISTFKMPEAAPDD